MYCQPLLSFGNSDISKLYKQGKLQTVKYGLYGGQLNVDNCTREHIKPKSKGGQGTKENIALATAENNQARGNKPLSECLSAKDVALWSYQLLIMPKSKNFDNIAYLKGNLKTIIEELQNERKQQ